MIATDTRARDASSIVRAASLRNTATRHATGLAAIVLVLSLAAFTAYLALYRLRTTTGAGPPASDLMYAACQVLPYGVVGAVLAAKRPDLPFGWLLSIGALSLVVQVAVVAPGIWAIESGHGSSLALWALTFGSLAFVPSVMQGLINVRFPSGRPTGRWGRLLERAIVAGTVLSLVGGLLGDSTITGMYPEGVPGGATRFIDGTPIVAVANLAIVAVPLTILLGALAGIGVVVRCIRARGVERKQLQWRAAGAVYSLALFPFAVAEVLPEWPVYADPFLFVVTLVVPVLRYDLWAIDTLIRRSATFAATTPGSVVEHMMRAVAEMLRLPYVAVQRESGVLASYGEPSERLEEWPLEHQGEHVGTLVAAPRRGLPSIGEQDRQVLATVAQLVAGSVRAEALTIDLLEARQRLVSAREEERRRLRRDLHDDLGPMLTGLGLNLDAAQSSLERHQEGTATYLGNAKEASTQVIAGLRELVYGLRPPALDDLGFVGALRLHTERIARDAALTLDLRIPSELTLPAAVEVAAFRTVVEAVTNAVRHSGADKVVVTIDPQPGRLVVTVTDDGHADLPATRPGGWQTGVGLNGMRERAEELGGTFEGGPTLDGGRVRAVYPLPGDRS